MKTVSLIALLAVPVVFGFSPVAPASLARTTHLAASGLEVVDATDPFQNYSIADPAQQLATKDEIVGSGPEAKTGDVVTIAYKGRLMSTGKQFDFGEGFTFKLGSGRVLPGWEQGLPGMKVGGKRVLRIPPELAFADRGAKDKIPPGSHLEFDCELLEIETNPAIAIYKQLNWQPERFVTFVSLLVLLAVSPSLPPIELPSF